MTVTTRDLWKVDVLQRLTVNHEPSCQITA